MKGAGGGPCLRCPLLGAALKYILSCYHLPAIFLGFLFQALYHAGPMIQGRQHWRPALPKPGPWPAARFPTGEIAADHIHAGLRPGTISKLRAWEGKASQDNPLRGLSAPLSTIERSSYFVVYHWGQC